MHALAALAVSSLLALQACTGAAAQREQDGDPVPCEAHLADSCWGDVTALVDCLLNPRSTRSRECERPSAAQLCRSLEDALHCSSEMDFENAGCVLKSGRENFDFWIRGLEAVNTKLCFEGLMTNIVSHAVCWDTLRFTRCVQHSVELLQHVVDLASLSAHTGLGAGVEADGAPSPAAAREHCHLTMLRVAKCASLAATMEPAPEVPPPEDHPAGVPFNFCAQAPPVDVINDLLAAYFSASECGGSSGGGAPACAPRPPPPQQQPATAAPEPAPAPQPEPPQGLPHLCASAAPATAAISTSTMLSVVTAVLIKFL